MIRKTAIRISQNRSTISLGRSRRSAERFSAAAIVPPPSSRNAPVTWKTSSHWYVFTRGSVRVEAPTYNRFRGRDRASPAPAHGDDRGGQLHARSRGGSLTRRA